MTDEQRAMTYEAIEDEYGPLVGPLSRVEVDSAIAARTIWTLLDGDAGDPLYVSGWHYVNRIDYYRSERAVPDGIAVYETPEEA